MNEDYGTSLQDFFDFFPCFVHNSRAFALSGNTVYETAKRPGENPLFSVQVEFGATVHTHLHIRRLRRYRRAEKTASF